MDPRSKTALVVLATGYAFLPGTPAAGALHAALVCLVCLLCLGPRHLVRPLRALVPILLFLVVLTPLFYTGGSPLVALFGRSWITDQGLERTFRFLCRLIAVTMVFYLYYQTTEMDEALAAARWYGIPDAACLVLGVALRLVPSVAALYRGVVDAHSLRRPLPTRRDRGPAAAIRRAVPVVSAVLVHSVKGIPLLAMALETRGVGRRNARTTYLAFPGIRRMVTDLAIALVVLGGPQLVIALI